MFEIVFAAMIASIGGTGAVQAQSSPAREPVAADSGPKTLLEGILGSTEKDKGKEGSDGEEHLDADRPHFPEATTTVGKGRAILESGYTFTKKGDSFLSHTVPEALLRVGVFADWFEFRIGQDTLHQRQTVDEVTTTANGAKDLYLGVKLALTEQKGWLPATVVIPQMTVPTGSAEVTAGRILPGVTVDFGWEVIKDVFNIELLIANNFVQDELNNSRSSPSGMRSTRPQVLHPLPGNTPSEERSISLLRTCKRICEPALDSTITPMISWRALVSPPATERL